MIMSVANLAQAAAQRWAGLGTHIIACHVVTFFAQGWANLGGGVISFWFAVAAVTSSAELVEQLNAGDGGLAKSCDGAAGIVHLVAQLAMEGWYPPSGFPGPLSYGLRTGPLIPQPNNGLSQRLA